MKTHFAIGLLIGAGINLFFQTTDASLLQVDLWELCLCALLAAFAAVVPGALAKAPIRPSRVYTR